MLEAPDLLWDGLLRELTRPHRLGAATDGRSSSFHETVADASNAEADRAASFCVESYECLRSTVDAEPEGLFPGSKVASVPTLVSPGALHEPRRAGFRGVPPPFPGRRSRRGREAPRTRVRFFGSGRHGCAVDPEGRLPLRRA